ncbi:MAG: FAD-dependent oxidoreductase [Gammaproteobacteria bacterium]|nr:FAD-dependent oxidoreductase [Gammaproteobacteria bacterium]
MNRRLFLRSAVAAGVSAAATPTLAAQFAALTEVSANVAAVTGDRTAIEIEQAAVKELADSLRGNVLLPGNPGYDVARRVLNSGIDKHPAFVVQPAGATDIRKAVTFARERELLLAVKCGGHSYAGKSTCDGGMQIDLSTLRHARVDATNRVAHVAGGSLLGELDRESMAAGLVTTAGTVSHTGIGGLTTAGGFGRVGRRFGLALDNVVGADVVTADGRLLHANAEENEDLFWAIRGGGGNFGIVTNFEMALHPMQRTVVGGDILYPGSMVREVFDTYREYAANASDYLYCDVYTGSMMAGTDSMAGFHVCWSGPENEADKVLAPLRALGTTIADTVKAWDYVDLQRSGDSTEARNVAQYMKAGFINDVPDSLIDAIADGFEPLDGRTVFLYCQHSGGAIGRVPTPATAFAHRKSLANMFVIVEWGKDAEADSHIRYIRDWWKQLEPATDGYYTVDTSDESRAVRHANYQANFPRLMELKNKYDPTNLFRLNANINPAG